MSLLRVRPGAPHRDALPALLTALFTVVIATVSSLALAAPLRAAPLGPATGTAVPIGGGLQDDNRAVWDRLVQAAGGKGQRWVVFGTASGEPEASAASAAKNLSRHGALASVVPVAPMIKGLDVARAVRDPKFIAQVRAARGVFFTGGSQDRITETLQPGGKRSPLLDAIWALYRRGGVVAGTSAGAAVMSDPMFRDAPDPVAVLKGRLRMGHELDKGLGFVGPGVFVDQHFFKRGRIGRLLPAMVANGLKTGVGVEENTAAFFHGDTVEVVGAKGAILVDLSEATQDAALGAFNLQNARVSYLESGDRIDLRTHAVQPSAARQRGQRIYPAEANYTPENDSAPFNIDMLGDNTFPNAMKNLIDNRAASLRGLAFDALTVADDPQPGVGFEFELSKDEHTRGWYSDATGSDGYTVTGMRLDVRPLRMAQPLYTPWKP